MGPTALFDKSALQALNIDESVWFEAFLLANITPVFYVETLPRSRRERGLASGLRTLPSRPRELPPFVGVACPSVEGSGSALDMPASVDANVIG
jgi:hypothetical protein